MLSPKKILVPIDFSDFSAKAMQYGDEFARTFQAELLVVHVLEMPVYPIALGLGSAPPLLTEEIVPEVKKRLESMAKDLVDPAVNVNHMVREGTPFVEIVQLARDESIDLIIMPTHGRTGIAHMIIGSTAERVVRKAPCPVLVLRDDEREFIHP